MFRRVPHTPCLRVGPRPSVILVVLFRVPVRRALLSLTRLKYKDLELDFGHELKQLEKEAKAIDITPQPAKSIAPNKKGILRNFWRRRPS